MFRANVIALTFVMVLAVAASVAKSEEKVAWNPANGIGKSNTWVTKAKAELADNLMKINFSEDGWSGVGLNFEGYWPEDAGIKASDYGFLVIEMSAVGEGIKNIDLTIKDNKGKESGRVRLVKYAEGGVISGEITTYKIPISDFLTDKSKLESGVIWEIMIGVWTQDAKDVDVVVRKISFVK